MNPITLRAQVKFCSKKLGDLSSGGGGGDGSPKGAAAEPLCLVHTDAAQSIGKVQVDVADLGVDLATIVGHKFGCEPPSCFSCGKPPLAVVHYFVLGTFP